MPNEIDRREFLKLTALAGVGAVFMPDLLPATAASAASKSDLFYFVQISDTHWGFEGAKINPDAKGTLIKAVKEINQLPHKPDFVVFTGDLTHTTDDTAIRKKRMSEFQGIVSDLDCKVLHFMPGENDAALDTGETYKDFFGKTHYTFDHKGVHFITIDNVSDPTGSIGEAQLEWLASDLRAQRKDQPIIVFTHRPLFDLYPQWDWATRDGAKAIELLMPFSNVTVFYGHIHQTHHHQTGHIAHHAATSLMMPFPAAGSAPKRMPIPWSETEPYKGLGFRNIDNKPSAGLSLTEYGINKEATI